MNHVIDEAMELKSYRDFLSEIKRRDIILFRLGLAALVVIFVVASITIYRWIESIDQRLEMYRLSLDRGTIEVNQLRDKIGEQAKDIEMYQSMVRTLNDVPVRTLIETSAEQRKEIDALKSKLQCVINNPNISLCR